MKIELEYVGKYQAKGIYEIEESRVKDLLNTEQWKEVNGSSDATKPPEEDLRGKLEDMSMAELRTWAKSKGLESKDNSKEELIEELLEELD